VHLLLRPELLRHDVIGQSEEELERELAGTESLQPAYSFGTLG
jgi:hypothetical protein